MGDILHAMPAITALRRAHPNWHIGWVVDPRWQALLTAGNREQGTESREIRGSAAPVVDRLHLAHTRIWKQHPLSAATRSQIANLRQELREARYDAVLDLQGAIRSAVIARMSGCPRRIGEARPREWPAHWLFTERIATQGAHVIEQDLELASAVAGDPLAFRNPLLPIDPEAETWCDAWLAKYAGTDGQASATARRLVLIAPGAGWGAKRWPPDRYATVAAGLAQRGFAVLVNAPSAEQSLAAPIAAAGAAPFTATLPQLIALTRRISLCIAGDTGPLHLACALGRPVVGIYGPTDPARNGPYGTRARILRSPESRRDYTHRDATDPGLLAIAPEDVMNAVNELMAEEKAK